jgi:hypothetical protein
MLLGIDTDDELYYTGNDIARGDTEGKEVREMKPRWLLLAVSILCLLVLFPAAAISQQQRPELDATCGSARVDGVMSPREWANAGKVDLFALLDSAPKVEIPVSRPDVEASQADDVGGQFWAMNDESHFYTAINLKLDNAALDPNWWHALGYILFTDEGNARDGQWDALDCGPPLPVEGWVWFSQDQMAPDILGWFTPDSQDTSGCDSEPLVGIQWAAGADRSLVFEHSFDLGSSELDKVGPGDCFRLGLWAYAFGCESGTDCAGGGNWLIGSAQWPEGFDGTPESFGEVCLDPCEVEFVPEPGSIMLLGSGLAGLAGYATVRLRSGQALR